MVSSLQSIVLFSVPIAMLIEMLKILHHLPMGHELFRALFRRCTHEELRNWAQHEKINSVGRALDCRSGKSRNRLRVLT